MVRKPVTDDWWFYARGCWTIYNLVQLGCPPLATGVADEIYDWGHRFFPGSVSLATVVEFLRTYGNISPGSDFLDKFGLEPSGEYVVMIAEPPCEEDGIGVAWVELLQMSNRIETHRKATPVAVMRLSGHEPDMGRTHTPEEQAATARRMLSGMFFEPSDVPLGGYRPLANLGGATAAEYGGPRVW